MRYLKVRIRADGEKTTVLAREDDHYSTDQMVDRIRRKMKKYHGSDQTEPELGETRLNVFSNQWSVVSKFKTTSPLLITEY